MLGIKGERIMKRMTINFVFKLSGMNVRLFEVVNDAEKYINEV